MNNQTIVGNLTADPELRFTSSGKPVANLRLADNRKGKDGQEDETLFLDVTVWNSLAENAAESLRKGDRVIASGFLRQREYENNEGRTIVKIELTAFNVGPDLSFARASVSKNPKDGGGSRGGGSTSPDTDPDVPF